MYEPTRDFGSRLIMTVASQWLAAGSLLAY